jgi:hypothetical protein
VPVLAFNFSGDVEALGEFNALGMKYDEAYNKNDAAALAALFAEDAVVVTDTGPIYGREAAMCPATPAVTGDPRNPAKVLRRQTNTEKWTIKNEHNKST